LRRLKFRPRPRKLRQLSVALLKGIGERLRVIANRAFWAPGSTLAARGDGGSRGKMLIKPQRALPAI
jgi:hypothetical protein